MASAKNLSDEFISMKTQFSNLLMLIVSLGTAAQAGVYSFDIPPSSGNPAIANSYAKDGVTFSYGVYAPLTDSVGSDIPGTERWQVDTGVGPVTVEKPFDYGRASTTETEMNALFQPVLVLLPPSTFLTGLGFKLESSTLSGNANPIQPVLFYNAQDQLIGSLQVNLASANADITSGAIAKASKVVLPAGKFYRQISTTTITDVPEVDARSLVAGVLFVGAVVYRRFKR